MSPCHHVTILKTQECGWSSIQYSDTEDRSRYNASQVTVILVVLLRHLYSITSSVYSMKESGFILVPNGLDTLLQAS